MRWSVERKNAPEYIWGTAGAPIIGRPHQDTPVQYLYRMQRHRLTMARGLRRQMFRPSHRLMNNALETIDHQ